MGLMRAFLPEFLLLVIAAVLLFLNVGTFEIDPYSEFFHIQSARESLFSGHFFLPVLNGHDYLIRAPFWTWIVIAFFKVLGVSLWAARMPAILCTLLSLVFTYLLTLELTQSRVSGLFAAAALLTTWGFFHGGSLATADSLATVIYLAFAWAMVQWQTLAARKTTIPLEMKVFSGGFGVLLGLLMLVKGTMPTLLLLIIAAGYLFLTQSTGLLRKLNFSLLIAPLAIIPLPWLISASIQSGNPGFIWNFLFTQPLNRIVGAGDWAQLKPDWVFYIKQLPQSALPYGLLIPAILLDSGSLSQRNNAQTPAWILWLLLWFGLGLTINSLTVFHETTRMLPFMPPIAVLAGYYLGLVAEHKAATSTYANTVVTYISLLMVGAVLFAMLIFQVIPSDYVTRYWHFPGLSVIESLTLGSHKIDLPEAFPIWKFWLIPGPFILLAGGFMLYLLQAERRLALTPATLVGTSLVFILFIKALYMPILYRPVPEHLARVINQQLKPQDGIVLYSLHPDIKRVLFYLDAKKLSQVRVVRHPEFIERQIAPQNGVIYGVIPEHQYFNDLRIADRAQLQVDQSDWKWDTGKLGELGKFLWIRQPRFDVMKSELLAFQTLPPASQQALRDVLATEAILSGQAATDDTPHHHRRRRH